MEIWRNSRGVGSLSVTPPPGLQAIYSECSRIYPDQPNPLQVTAVVKYWYIGLHILQKSCRLTFTQRNIVCYLLYAKNYYLSYIRHKHLDYIIALLSIDPCLSSAAVPR